MVAKRDAGTTTYCQIADPTVFRLCELVCEGDWGRLKGEAWALGLARGGRRSAASRPKNRGPQRRA